MEIHAMTTHASARMRRSSETVRQAVPGDEAYILALADAALGAGYVDHAALASAACFVAVDAEEILGFVCVEPHTPQCDERVLKTIVVAPAHRGRGIARHLVLVALYAFPGSAWRSPAWVSHGGEVPADRLLRSLGFVSEDLIHNYWYIDSLSRGYLCPNCGNPCQCSAMIYHRVSP